MAEPGPQPRVLLADMGYGADFIKGDLEACDIAVVIPGRKTARDSRGSKVMCPSSETSSSEASLSSSTAADWPPTKKRPPTVTSASSRRLNLPLDQAISPHDLDINSPRTGFFYIIVYSFH